jgi:hypothetical protein
MDNRGIQGQNDVRAKVQAHGMIPGGRRWASRRLMMDRIPAGAESPSRRVDEVQR